MYYENITQLIGDTPLLKLNNIIKDKELKANIFAKVEFFNPGGSVKDRIAKGMFFAAIENGDIKEDTVIYEPTSGNTGIGAALVGAALGYKVVIVMPESVSVERIQIVKAYGAEVILTDKADGMKGAIAKVQQLLSENENSVTLSQFENYENPTTHFNTTAREIIKDLNGEVDVVVSGVGTGGTVTGIATYFNDLELDTEIIAVEPTLSAVISGNEPSPHKIAGIGAGFIPNVLNVELLDRIIQIDDEDAIETANYLARTEGVFSGISSGAALAAAIQVAQDEKYEGKNIVVILPDTGERYLSTGAFGQ
ncbi:MAG: cysteine synthase A [Erysipelothrix sp.]|nr:cysteine synthase A [Erysipelothrix sp.]